jgi:gamma-glutamyltranspeptidase/glutathione hydrolase
VLPSKRSQLDSPYRSERSAVLARRGMVCASVPAAAAAGVEILGLGGNAIDAALAAAAVLCVVEPMSTGIGGDAFAIVVRDGEVTALDAAGPAPARAESEEPQLQGPRSVDVPGAVAGWAALAERHGRLGLDACLADAIDAARRGFALGRHTAALWQEAPAVPHGLPARPAPGERIVMGELATTLERIAAEGPDAFYRGRVAESICGASWLSEDDLSGYAPLWVKPLSLRYGDVEVLELPPPTQGVAALEGLGLYAEMPPGTVSQVEAARLALADAFTHVRDGADVRGLLAPEFLAQRRGTRPDVRTAPDGGTVYLCAVDGDRMAVSFIQSLFAHFGSGLAAPGTGVVLNNRAACFSVNGRVEPGRRPYHTIIPGMLLRDGALLGPFGVMGGFIQAQAHLQLVSALVDDGCDPQAALDRARFRVEGADVLLEEGLWAEAGALERLGLRPVCSRDTSLFGAGQAILVSGDVLTGGSDARRDGYAAGF